MRSNDFPLGVDDDIILIVKLERVLLIYDSNITGRVFGRIIHGMITYDNNSVHTRFVRLFGENKN